MPRYEQMSWQPVWINHDVNLEGFVQYFIDHINLDVIHVHN